MGKKVTTFVGDAFTGGAVTAGRAARDAKRAAREEEERLKAQEAQRKLEEDYDKSIAGLQSDLSMEQSTVESVGDVTKPAGGVSEADFINALEEDEEEDKLKKAFRRK